MRSLLALVAFVASPHFSATVDNAWLTPLDPGVDDVSVSRS
jgi:hypothetical protein